MTTNRGRVLDFRWLLAAITLVASFVVAVPQAHAEVDVADLMTLEVVGCVDDEVTWLVTNIADDQIPFAIATVVYVDTVGAPSAYRVFEFTWDAELGGATRTVTEPIANPNGSSNGVYLTLGYDGPGELRSDTFLPGCITDPDDDDPEPGLQPVGAMVADGAECTDVASPLLVTNPNDVEVDYRVDYLDPPSLSTISGTVSPNSTDSVNVFHLGAGALVQVEWFDGAEWRPLAGGPMIVPDDDCLLSSYQQFLFSGCVDETFVVEIVHYTAFSDLTVEVEGGPTIALEPGQSQTVEASDVNGDGLVSTKQTGPITDRRTTVDTPFRDCSLPPVLCNGLVATIVGTNGNDLLRGTSGPDVIAALNGNDTIHGLGGDDVICAGSGRDRAFGGGGDDIINGGAANDVLSGGAGRDTLRGQVGRDTLRGGSGNDRLFGDAGPDILIGQGGRDTCHGGDGTDRARTCEVLVDVP